MEFPFSVAQVFGLDEGGVVALDARRYTALGAQGRERADRVMAGMGRGSMLAQHIPQQITTPHHVSAMGHVLFLAVSGNRCLGILKGGEKHLFMLDGAQETQEMDALCCLDFYTHESTQRRGVGLTLFRAMEQYYGIKAEGWAFDKPSPKLLGFLRKHYSITGMRPQTNNFLMHGDAIAAWGRVFRQCFRRAAVIGGHSSSPATPGHLGTSGLVCDMLERAPSQYRAEITSAGKLLRSAGVVEADLWSSNPFTGRGSVPEPASTLAPARARGPPSAMVTPREPFSGARGPAERTAVSSLPGEADGRTGDANGAPGVEGVGKGGRVGAAQPGQSGQAGQPRGRQEGPPLYVPEPLPGRNHTGGSGNGHTQGGQAARSVSSVSLAQPDLSPPEHPEPSAASPPKGLDVNDLLARKIVVSPASDSRKPHPHQPYVRQGYNQAETTYTKKAESLADQQRSLNSRTANMAKFMSTHGGYGIGGMSQASYDRYIKDMEGALQ